MLCTATIACAADSLVENLIRKRMLALVHTFTTQTKTSTLEPRLWQWCVVVACCDAAAAAAHNDSERGKRATARASQLDHVPLCRRYRFSLMHDEGPYPLFRTFPLLLRCSCASRSFSYILVLLGSHCTLFDNTISFIQN